GHHEFGNAETIFLVGDALGKGMTGLLAGRPVGVADPPRPLAPAPRPVVPLPTAPTTQRVEGWNVRVDDRLMLPENAELRRKALRFLENKLADIVVVVPPDRVEKLRAVTIQLDLNYGKIGPMQYHPSAGWLKANGYATNLAKC